MGKPNHKYFDSIPANCIDCFKWTPEQLSFNSRNFQERQTLTITRIKDGPTARLIPIFYGGGYNLVSPDIYSIFIQ